MTALVVSYQLLVIRSQSWQFVENQIFASNSFFRKIFIKGRQRYFKRLFLELKLRHFVCLAALPSSHQTIKPSSHA